MPVNKDLKRLVRSRMRKTGESYTSARTQLLAKRSGAPQTVVDPESPAGPAIRAGMGDAAVRAKTGRTWGQWTRALDAWGAAEKPHRDIARHLHDTFGLEGWWAQTVTVGYERIRGLRDVGQRRGGDYEVSKSRTYPVALTRLYAACATAPRRRAWLPEPGIVARKATAGKSLRWTWPDGTNVELLFYAKGHEKSQVVIQHRKLATREDAAQVKRLWEARLDALASALAGTDRVTGSPRSRRGASALPKSRPRRKTAVPTRP